MKRLLLTLSLLLLLASSAWATISLDTVTDCSSSTGDITCSHAGSASAKGVVVFINYEGTSDQVVSVDYDGESMAEVTGSPNILTTGEVGIIHAYFLGVGVNGGTVDVFIDVDAGQNKKARVITFLAATDDTAVQDENVIINSGDCTGSGTPYAWCTASGVGQDPRETLSLSSNSSLAVEFLYTGKSNVDHIDIISGSAWTVQFEGDWGSKTNGTYTHDVTSSDVTMGFDSTNPPDDMLAVGVAVTESGAAPPARSRVVDVN